MTRFFAPRPVVALALSGLLSGCAGAEDDGRMFQRWAEAVAAIPVSTEDLAAEARAAPPLVVQVVEASEMPSRRAGLRPPSAESLEPLLHYAAARVTEAVAPATPPPVPRAAPETVRASGVLVQLAAFRTEGDARAAWARLAEVHGELAGLTPLFETVDLGQAGRWTRLKVGPFASAEQAAAVCRQAGVADRWCVRAAT